MTKTYTIADLCALPDNALDAMAAELRGWNKDLVSYEQAYWDGMAFANGELLQDEVYKEGDRIIIETDKWKPTTRRNQSGDLLACAVSKGVKADVCFRPDAAYVTFYIEAIPLMRSIPGNDARAETIAFCAAMLAMAGRLKGE